MMPVLITRIGRFMKIIIDYDNTAADTQKAGHDFTREVYPDATYDQMPLEMCATKWPIYGSAEVFWGLQPAFINSHYFMGIKPINGAPEGLGQLRDDGHKLIVLSKMGRMAQSRRIDNSLEIFGPVFDDIICIDPHESKAEWMRKLRAEAIIDDSPNDISAALSVPTMKLPIMFARPMQSESVRSIRFIQEVSPLLSGNWRAVNMGELAGSALDYKAIAERVKVAYGWEQAVSMVRAWGRDA